MASNNDNARTEIEFLLAEALKIIERQRCPGHASCTEGNCSLVIGLMQCAIEVFRQNQARRLEK